MIDLSKNTNPYFPNYLEKEKYLREKIREVLND